MPVMRHHSDLFREATGGTETSHYPEEQKTTVIPLVAASERGTAQTVVVSSPPALRPRGRGTVLLARWRQNGVRNVSST